VFDGEGKEIASGGIDDWGTQYVNCFANNLYLSDFNGNGKTDLLVMNGTKSWVYELQGKTFVRLSSFETTYLRNSYFPYFADFNGDGKTDILY
ncbi:FG-GAP repeat domain-containing protein, partial [Parabacteroides merdae]